MIIGVGVDSIEIGRVARAVGRNSRLRSRLFTPSELAQVPRGPKAPSRMAALFAAKEATLKALGTGLRGHSWQQVEVLHRESGDPYVVLYGQALETAGRLGITSIHISLSHDRERAVAFCIAEGEE